MEDKGRSGFLSRETEKSRPGKFEKTQLCLNILEDQRWIKMKVRELIIILKADGWYLVATKGIHQQYKHPDKPGRVTIAAHSGHDLAPGTLNTY
ncbi:MAG: type II toxin-antitoxin system HicA family toxin [Bacteroidales bacterium]|nr:type II toxin-antitoxin system HicA family toxin [Methanosarcinaceae archaeon]MDD4431417.1 type II toxin-antitoxin system HicA family toxin [Bacteroidales bacterium]